MSIFWIFCVCLTVVYIIYYTVLICSDLYRKPKDRSTSSVETFEVAEQPDSQPAHKLDASGDPVSPLDEKMNEASESMEQIRPEMSGELMSITMESALKEGRPPLQIEKKVTPAPESETQKEQKDNEDAVTE